MTNFKKQIIFFIIFFLVFIFPKKTLALRYSLIAPSGTLDRGQTVTFTINVDTQGEVVTNAQIGMTYETQYLEYINTIAGDAFPTLTTQPQGGGKLLFSATSAGFNGSGTFAQVNFRIIAQAPGESQLCVLWQPTSPTAQPTSPTAQPTSPTAQPTSPQPTSPPRAIPTSGESSKTKSGLILGGGLIFLSIGVLVSNSLIFINRKKFFSDANRNK
jgi:hypothetical protein